MLLTAGRVGDGKKVIVFGKPTGISDVLGILSCYIVLHLLYVAGTALSLKYGEMRGPARTCEFRLKPHLPYALARWFSWLECCPLHQRIVGSIPGQGTYLGCRCHPKLGYVREANN